MRCLGEGVRIDLTGDEGDFAGEIKEVTAGEELVALGARGLLASGHFDLLGGMFAGCGVSGWCDGGRRYCRVCSRDE